MAGLQRITDMEAGAGMGWLAAILVGGVAGWLAEMFMKSNMGLIMNIILGIVGAIVANAILAAIGVSIGTGWVAYLIAGFIGACILIAMRAHSPGGRRPPTTRPQYPSPHQVLD